MPSCPRNYPFYNWVPKPVGIIILLFFFLPILSVGGVYSVNSTEMMSGLGIISEHIQFANFVTSIGMAAFAPFCMNWFAYAGKADVHRWLCTYVCFQLCVCQN